MQRDDQPVDVDTLPTWLVEVTMAQMVTLAAVLLVAVIVLVWSIVYRIREVREEQAAWDAVIDRVCGGLVSTGGHQVTQEEGAREI